MVFGMGLAEEAERVPTNDWRRSDSSGWYVRASSDRGRCLSTMRAIVAVGVRQWVMCGLGVKLFGVEDALAR